MNYIQSTERDWAEGYFKLGSSDDPWKRAKAFSTGNSATVCVLFAWPDDDKSEREIHKKFVHTRIEKQGVEWFQWNSEWAAFVHEQVDKFAPGNFPRFSFLSEGEMVRPLGVPALGEIPRQVSTIVPDDSRQPFIPDELPKINKERFNDRIQLGIRECNASAV
jgi:hypothetical protein